VDAVPQQHLDLNYVKVTPTASAEYFRLVRNPEPPCQILIFGQPQDVTVEPGQVATFFVEAAGNPLPEKFQWQLLDRNGEWTDIPEANKPILLFNPGSEPFFAWPWPKLRCVIDNGCTSVTSAEAVLTVKSDGDTVPPMVQMVFSECPAPMIIVQFSEPVLPEQAMNPENYQLRSGPLSGPKVLEIQVMGPQMVQLFLSGPVPPEGAFLNVSNVHDLAGNVIPEGNMTPVNCGGISASRE